MMRNAQPEAELRLAVDGGIKSQTIELTAKAGANTFIAGSGIFSHPDGVSAGVAELRQRLSS